MIFHSDRSHKPAAPAVLPIHANHDNAISPCGAYIGKASSHTVKSSEVGRISGVESRVRQPETLVLGRIVHVEPNAQLGAVAEPKILRQRHLRPKDPGPGQR